MLDIGLEPIPLAANCVIFIVHVLTLFMYSVRTTYCSKSIVVNTVCYIKKTCISLQATIDLVVGYEPPAGPANPNDPGGTSTQEGPFQSFLRTLLLKDHGDI